MTLLAEDIEFEEVEDVLRREPGLWSSGAPDGVVGSNHGLRRQVRTVREALVLLGTTRIRQWIALTILSGQPGKTPDGLGHRPGAGPDGRDAGRPARLEAPEVAFTAGLLSALDLLLGVELAELEHAMDIDEALKDRGVPPDRAAGPAGGRGGALPGASWTRAAPSRTPPASWTRPRRRPFAWAMPYVSSLETTG